MPAQTSVLKKPFSFAIFAYFAVKSVGIYVLDYYKEFVYSAGTNILLTHGNEFFLTVGRNFEPDGDIDMRQMQGGL